MTKISAIQGTPVTLEIPVIPVILEILEIQATQETLETLLQIQKQLMMLNIQIIHAMKEMVMQTVTELPTKLNVRTSRVRIVTVMNCLTVLIQIQMETV